MVWLGSYDCEMRQLFDAWSAYCTADFGFGMYGGEVLQLLTVLLARYDCCTTRSSMGGDCELPIEEIFNYSGKAARGKFSVAFFFVIFCVAIGYARLRSTSI